MHKVYKNPTATSKFPVPEGCHEPSSILTARTYWAPQKTIQLTPPPATWGPGFMHHYS